MQAGEIAGLVPVEKVSNQMEAGKVVEGPRDNLQGASERGSRFGSCPIVLL